MEAAAITIDDVRRRLAARTALGKDFTVLYASRPLAVAVWFQHSEVWLGIVWGIRIRIGACTREIKPYCCTNNEGEMICTR